MNISSRPMVSVRPAARPATPARAASPAPRPAAKAPAAAAAPEVSARTVGTVAGAATGGVVGFLFGSVLAAGGLSGVLPVALAVGGAALLARGGAVIADAVKNGFKWPTLAQGLVGGAAGVVMGGGVFALTGFAAGMAGVGWLALASIPMGLVTAAVGGTAIGSFIPKGDR